MKVSMNGLRRNLSGDVNRLKDMVSSVLSGDAYDEEDLKEAMNEVITQSNVLNCVYHDGDDDFSDMGDVEVAHLD